MQDDEKTYRDTQVLIHELIERHEAKLKGLSFVNCSIIGPAVLYLQYCIADTIKTQHGPRDVLWEVHAGRKLIGAVLMESCTFENCTFHHIGFAGLPAQIQLWRETMSRE